MSRIQRTGWSLLILVFAMLVGGCGNDRDTVSAEADAEREAQRQTEALESSGTNSRRSYREVACENVTPAFVELVESDGIRPLREADAVVEFTVLPGEDDREVLAGSEMTNLHLAATVVRVQHVLRSSEWGPKLGSEVMVLRPLVGETFADAQARAECSDGLVPQLRHEDSLYIAPLEWDADLRAWRISGGSSGLHRVRASTDTVVALCENCSGREGLLPPGTRAEELRTLVADS